MHTIVRFLRDEAGVTAIEYTLLASVLAVSIIVWAVAIGGTLNANFVSIDANFGTP